MSVTKKQRTTSKQPRSSTRGSPPTKDQTSSDNSTSKTIPESTLSTSQASHSSTSTRKPFWNDSIQKLSEKLWCPTLADQSDWAWTFWSGSSNTVTQQTESWFSTKLTMSPTKPSYKTTYSQPLLASWHATTDEGRQSTKDSTKRAAKQAKCAKPLPNAAKKYRLVPTLDQKRLMTTWMDTNRWTYNLCVSVAEHTTDESDLRKMFVNNDVFERDPKDAWVLDTPSDIRANAVRDFVKNVKSNKASVAAGLKKHFTMHYSSKKKLQQQSFEVRNRGYKQESDMSFSVFPKFFEKHGVSPIIFSREPLPKTIAYDARLIRTRLDEWYLSIPTTSDMPYAIGGESQAPFGKVCSLDPGVRTFQTIYDPDGSIIELGAKDYDRLGRLCRTADKLKSRRAKIHGKKRYTLKKAYLRIFRKVERLVHEIHCKTVKFLVDNYNVVLLPSFDTSDMVKRGKRKIRSKTARSMLTWSHYRFKQRLLDKASHSHHCTVVICTEEFTSKTCGVCGFNHQKLGSSKIFKCPQCAFVVDRDHNAARNILLKHASLFQFQWKGH